MDWLFLMDPPDHLVPERDTTLALMRAATRRGHRTYWADFTQLGLAGDEAWVVCRPMDPETGERGRAVLRPVESFEVGWLRVDPPFDQRWLEATWILDFVSPRRTLLVNRPGGVRAANEKLFALRFPTLCPETIVTSDASVVRRFVEQQGEAVLKPLDGHGGDGILFAEAGMRGLRALCETAVRRGRIEAQRYVEGAERGDKRIVLLDGEPLGAILRVHAPGEERNNLHHGGTAHAATLDEADRRIIDAVAPTLRAEGLVFVGLDVLAGRLTEVNVTSPTGLVELERLAGIAAADRVIDWCEANAPVRADEPSRLDEDASVEPRAHRYPFPETEYAGEPR